jgi:hypothetical protein
MDHPLDGARERIKRANRHRNDLATAIKAYATSEANNIVIDHDYVRDQPNIILAPKAPLPLEFAVIVNDCIHNLRAREDSGDREPTSTQFPITSQDRFTEYRNLRLKNNVPLRYLSDAHVDAIEAYQPYNRIKWTETLRDISNPEKHRKLTRIRSGRRTDIADGRGEVFKGLGPTRTDVQLEGE